MRQILPPRFSRYDVGMYYRPHLDAVTMPARNGKLRTDLSLTICLNDASEFDGGELVIETESGVHQFKGGRAMSCFTLVVIFTRSLRLPAVQGWSRSHGLKAAFEIQLRGIS